MGVSIMCRKNQPLPLARKGHGREEVEDGPTGTKTVDTAEATEAGAVGAQKEAKEILRGFPHQAVSGIPRDSTKPSAGTVGGRVMVGKDVRQKGEESRPWPL